MVGIIRQWQKLMSIVCKSKDNVPPDVPEGHLAVYAGYGCERQRFIVPAIYFNHSLFRPLLDKAEEMFGFNHSGPILILCKPLLFEQILGLLSGNSTKILNVEELVKRICDKDMETEGLISSVIRNHLGHISELRC
ncbi:hypothetical protein SUGI_0129670 [Cryptomeria japonica]|uniref:protein SMALL AUXIN UP-REGULATED RNA 12-like n=1 Tax=Cryptomeria japonica TaxID=3369 RepID=UPI0024089D6C|nr:protein SMALL AUXIN UP-REGULATED RNA 12-like [Cryptomeria japonica]GLJ10518.1 hypothetical protein SUGI_0129670 [Cryptomeria japonica]